MSEIDNGQNSDAIVELKKNNRKHKLCVQYFLEKVLEELKFRGLHHDDSKEQSPELENYAIALPYFGNRGKIPDEVQDALNIAKQHHYTNNDHHLEYYDPSGNGIHKTNLIVLLEMMTDWRAAMIREGQESIEASLDMTQKRFGYSDEVRAILKNTLLWLDQFSDEIREKLYSDDDK